MRCTALAMLTLAVLALGCGQTPEDAYGINSEQPEPATATPASGSLQPQVFAEELSPTATR